MDWSYRLTVENAERGGSNYYWLIPVVMVGAIIVTVKVIINHRGRPSDGLDS
jgi:hypothetical protein